MDKTKLARLVTTGKLKATTIASTATRQDRDRLVRDFLRELDSVQYSEVVLVMVRT